MRSDHSLHANIVTHQSIREFFFDSVNDAVKNQHIDASDETKHYLVNLLTSFSRSEELFEYGDDGASIRPLALRYIDALAEASSLERQRILQKLGDTALFITGVFPHSLNRKLIDVDYYIAMGGNAYSYLSESLRGRHRSTPALCVFEELTRRFIDFVDVLAEVSERVSLTSNHDIMRLYEVWLRTGSRRTRSLLQRLGIDPVAGSATDFRH